MMYRSARAALLVLISRRSGFGRASHYRRSVAVHRGAGRRHRQAARHLQAGRRKDHRHLRGRYGKSNLEGTVKENHVEFTVTVVAEGTTVSGLFRGTYENDRMSGDVEYEGAGDGTWTAVRVPAKK